MSRFALGRWLVICGILASACSTSSSTAPSATPPSSPKAPTATVPTTTIHQAVDLSTRPVIWFTPHPALNLPGFVKGSSDYWDLFDQGSPWSTADEKVQVFKTYDLGADQVVTDDQEVRTLITGLESRGLAFAMELGALPLYVKPGPIEINADCGVGIEGFSGIFAVQTVSRIHDLGGRVDLVAFDEPFAHGHVYEGENACEWPVEKVADEIAAFVMMLREVNPSIVVGDIEPMWPEITADVIAGWLDAYEYAAGEPLGFFHLDVNWALDDWPQRAREIEQVVKSRGITFGIIYNGGDAATSDTEWLQLAAESAYTYEEEWGGRPDHVVFQSWHFYPTRVLPEDDLNAFTSLINRYFAPRTALTVDVSGSPDGLDLQGRLLTTTGEPVPETRLSIEAIPLDGQAQTLTLTGEVPEGVDTGEVGIRINTEGAGPGTADIRIYDVGYFEEGEEGNRVTGPLFGVLPEHEMSGISLVPSDIGEGTMLRLTAAPDEEINLGSTRFPVTPGANYLLTVTASVPVDSEEAGYAAMLFHAGVEQDRHLLRLAPVAGTLGNAATDSAGRFGFSADDLMPGRYLVNVSYSGDLDHWPSWFEFELQVGP